MEQAADYIRQNRESWNNRTAYHIQSDFYDVPAFLAGRSSLKEIELDLLGDVRGKRILHLQCHFGQDTISLARMGALVTGVDLSDKAIEYAAELSVQAGTPDARFICCDLYALPEVLQDEQFDIVFSSYGTIGWLPDMDRWAAVIAQYLRPGGSFVFAEFHPAVWMFDDDFRELGYAYLNEGPIVEQESGTYADRNAPMQATYVCWNHGLGEVLTALSRSGLRLELLQEFDYAPYNCFRHTVEFEPGKFRIAHLGNRLPMVYALRAIQMAESYGQ